MLFLLLHWTYRSAKIFTSKWNVSLNVRLRNLPGQKQQWPSRRHLRDRDQTCLHKLLPDEAGRWVRHRRCATTRRPEDNWKCPAEWRTAARCFSLFVLLSFLSLKLLSFQIFCRHLRVDAWPKNINFYLINFTEQMRQKNCLSVIILLVIVFLF